MPSITVRFTTKWPYNPMSLLIARATGSREWSHTFCIIDGMAYEATMMHGCRVVALGEAMRGVVAYQDMEVPVADVQSAKLWGMLQAGKGYDFAGAFGLPFLMSEDWSDDRKWWCSELTFVQLGIAGTWVLDPDERSRVTPNDLRQCNYPKSPIVRLPSWSLFSKGHP